MKLGIKVDNDKIKAALKSQGAIYKLLPVLGMDRAGFYRRVRGELAWSIRDLNAIAKLTGRKARSFLMDMPL